MSKKFYMAPESEELMLEIQTAILAGSGVTDINDGDAAEMGGSDNNEGDGF